MHVCIVTSAHPWDDVRVGTRMLETFIGAGYRVTWVGPDKSGPGKPNLREGVDYRLFPSPSTRAARLQGAKRALSLAENVPDVEWWYTPDPDVATRLPRHAGRFGGKTLFDIHESYHGGLLNRWWPLSNPPTVVRDLVKRRIARAARQMDQVIGVSRGVLDPYTTGQSKVEVIRNCAPSFFAEIERDSSNATTRMRVMHGKLSGQNGSTQVLDALRVLGPSADAGLEVLMLDVGKVADANASTALGRPLPQAVNLLPGVSHQEMAHLMATCDVGLISYQRDLGLESLPNRVFEYMAAGMSIVAPSYSPEIASLIQEEQIGMVADFEDPQAVAGALQWCLNHPDQVSAMGKRARAAFLVRHNWQAESKKLIEAMRCFE